MPKIIIFDVILNGGYSKWRENALFNNAYKINMLLFVCINQFMPLLPRTNGNVLFSSSSLCILSSACMKRIAIAINVVPWTQYTTQCLQTESFSKIYIFWEMVSNQSMKCRYTCNVYDNWKLILALALLYFVVTDCILYIEWFLCVTKQHSHQKLLIDHHLFY